MTPMTLGRLARACGLARSSVLHYEALGLLSPGARSAAGYRLYGPAQVQQLQQIRQLREAGLSLAAIAALLARPRDGAAAPPAAHTLLQDRLLELGQEMARLRQQQRQLARLLADPALADPTQADAPACRSKADWVALLQRAGFDEAEMQRWHQEFEQQDPVGHARFLRALGLPAAQIRSLRAAARHGPGPQAKAPPGAAPR